MKFIDRICIILSIITLFISGCGGGGGGSSTPAPTTKQATIVLSSQGTPSLIGGFELSLTLPPGATVLTDVGGTPLSSEVFLSGQFAAYTLLPGTVSYNVATRILSVAFASADSISLGEFLTVKCIVPIAYTPDPNDLSYTTRFFEPNNASELPLVTATATFN